MWMTAAEILDEVAGVAGVARAMLEA